MGEGAAEGIDSGLVHVRLQAGQFRRAHIDAGELFPAQIVGYGHRYEARPVVDLAQQLLAPVVGDGDQGPRRGDGGFRVLRLVLEQQEAEVRPVGRQLDAVAVQYPAARRWHQAEIVLVGGRERRVAAVFEDLQLGQPRAQRRQPQRGQAAHDEGAPVEDALALIDFAEEEGRFGHLKRTSASSNRSISVWANG